ncbi:hypothetical protein Q3G72_015492 [Acer saccharum]|nr:hypothetical protein Q3G72_015492 [Acer saccharum]
MANVQQQQVNESWGSGSNCIAAINIDGTTPSPNNKTFDDPNHQLSLLFEIVVDDDDEQKPGWRKFLTFVGHGFLVSLAYLDPGNLETDLQAGANHGFELLWVVLIGMIFALITQSLAANLGVSTVTGTAFALNILFNIPVWVGVLLTGLSTLLLLGLQRYGVRKLDMLIAVLVFVMAGCFFGEMSYVKPPAANVLKGMFIPMLTGQGAIGDAIALFGALVMPHNLFLHSALVLSRKVPNSVHGINLFQSQASSAQPLISQINAVISHLTRLLSFSRMVLLLGDGVVPSTLIAAMQLLTLPHDSFTCCC